MRTERILQAALIKLQIIHEGKQVRFFQDLSVDVMRKRREFDTVKKILVDRKMFCGFAYPAQLRCFYDSELSYVQDSSRGGRVHRDFAR